MMKSKIDLPKIQVEVKTTGKWRGMGSPSFAELKGIAKKNRGELIPEFNNELPDWRCPHYTKWKFRSVTKASHFIQEVSDLKHSKVRSIKFGQR